MSTADGGPMGRREVAYRLFAAEYDDADLEYSDSDEQRAPNFVVTPTGARVNRVFVVGVLTEVERVGDNVLRGRVADPTGAFVVYAGQYQPDAVAFLEGAEVPSFVALTGKARTFRPDDGDRTYTSIRPESMTSVDAATRDRWTVQAAEHTLARVATMARALERAERGEALEAVLSEAGVSPGLAAGVPLALDHYGTTAGYLSAVRRQALAAAEVASGGRDEVPAHDLAPDEDGPVEGDLTGAPSVYGTLTAEAATELPSVAAPPAGGGGAPAEGASSPAAGDPSVTAGTSTGTIATLDGQEAQPEPAAAGADDSEPAAGEPSADADDLGDFEPSHTDRPGDDADAVSDEETMTGATGELYELGEAERDAVEEEFGTEFSTGGEVDEPGEAGIEPEAEQPPASSRGDGDEPRHAEPAAEAGDEAEESSIADEPPDTDGEGSSEVDLEDAVVEAMADLDDGEGADREAVVSSVAETHGVDVEAVEAAVQAALMGGRCYEPSDGSLKAI